MTLFANDFYRVFSKLLQRTGVTCYQISRFTHLDQAYLSRLKKGKKYPSPETVVKIALAFARLSKEISIYELEELVNSIGRSLHINN